MGGCRVLCLIAFLANIVHASTSMTYISHIDGPITPVAGNLVTRFTLPVEYSLQFDIKIENVASSTDFVNALAISYGSIGCYQNNGMCGNASRAPAIFACPSSSSPDTPSSSWTMHVPYSNRLMNAEVDLPTFSCSAEYSLPYNTWITVNLNIKRGEYSGFAVDSNTGKCYIPPSNARIPLVTTAPSGPYYYYMSSPSYRPINGTLRNIGIFDGVATSDAYPTNCCPEFSSSISMYSCGCDANYYQVSGSGFSIVCAPCPRYEIS